MTADLLAAALDYASRGWPVIPIEPGPEKSPRTDPSVGLVHGFHDATDEPELIRAYWSRWPADSIGIACGYGCDVLDVDGPDGRESLAILLAELGLSDVPPDWVASASGREDGGTHYWFAPGGPVRWRGFRPHLDWLGRRGYVIAPPSVHPTGRVYRWLAGHPPGTLPAAPPGLHAAATRPVREARPPQHPAGIPAEGRPGDDFERRMDWGELLEADSARIEGHRGDETYWTRPGKARGTSAAVGYQGKPNLYVFTSNWPGLEADTAYSKFAYWAATRHAGDFTAAARDLARRGYGTPNGQRPAAAAAARAAPPGEPPDDPWPATDPHDAAADKPDAPAQPTAAALPPFVRLDELLTRPARQVRYRIDGLWPEGGRIVCNAAWKAGKTTLVGNLVRSLVDGDPFLDRYDVASTGRTVVVLDDELSEDMLADWYRDQGIEHTDRVYVVFLRGRAGDLNLPDPATLEVWAARLRELGAGAVILDCLSPVLAALNLDEYRTPDVRRFLAAFDALLLRAGAPEGGIIHHAGHNTERGRGASALRDWPDAEWMLVREKPDDPGDEPDPAAPRYLKAYGRDVDQPEQRLNYDPRTRRLSVAGASRRAERRDRHVPKVIDIVTRMPGVNASKLIDALTDAGVRLHPAREARERAIACGLVVEKPGPNRQKLHYLPEPELDWPDESGPSVRQGPSDPPTDHRVSGPSVPIGDGPPPHHSACAICGDGLDDALTAADETTHPGCQPSRP